MARPASQVILKRVGSRHSQRGDAHGRQRADESGGRLAEGAGGGQHEEQNSQPL